MAEQVPEIMTSQANPKTLVLHKEVLNTVEPMLPIPLELIDHHFSEIPHPCPERIGLCHHNQNYNFTAAGLLASIRD